MAIQCAVEGQARISKTVAAQTMSLLDTDWVEHWLWQFRNVCSREYDYLRVCPGPGREFYYNSRRRFIAHHKCLKMQIG